VGGLIDAVRAGEEIPQTKDEIRKRWTATPVRGEDFNVTIPAIP